LITTIIEKSQMNNIPIIILGDFNADTQKTNYFAKILNKFLKDNNLTDMCEKFPQTTQYTYTCLNRDSTFYSKLDHVLTIQDDPNAYVNIVNCIIQNDPSNTSDHNAIRLEFKLSGNNNNNHDPTI
jgi:endonuclease/exonuclease/phosphatase family metal-dependent hydrolase